jgi:voltage-gated potassium channel
MHLLYQINRRLKHIRRSFSSALKGQIAVLGLLFLILMALHVLAMMLFEGLSLGDATWLTITTATTVGYGDISASTTAGRLATGLLMYLGGIFILAQLAGLVFEATAEKREQRVYGKLPISAKGHIVIFGWREQYITDTVAQIRASIAPLHEADIIIVSENMTYLPSHLLQQQVRHVVGPVYKTDTFRKAALEKAACVVISPEQGGTDFFTLDLIGRLIDDGVKAPITVELLDKKHLQYALSLGASHAQLFNPNYPDMLARSILAPGAEVLVEEITKDSKTEMLVLHLPMECKVAKVRQAVHGTATLLGFQSSGSTYELHPADGLEVKDCPLIFLVDTDRFENTPKARQMIKEQLQPLLEDREVQGFSVPQKAGVIGGGANRVTAAYLKALQRELDEEVSITHVCEDCWSDGSLKATDLEAYNALILLSDDPLQPEGDAKIFSTLHLLRNEWGYKGRLIAEASLPGNQERFTAAGANDVIRPITNNLEILARCILTGAEEVLDNLFSSEGHELLRVGVQGELEWQQLADRLAPLGLLLGYEDGEEKVDVLPLPTQVCRFQALFLLVERDRFAQFEVLEQTVRQVL